jgi:3-phosphoshikimate 1-carboxyvinyltransferase
LRIKETDRLEALKAELEKCGVETLVQGSRFEVPKQSFEHVRPEVGIRSSDIKKPGLIYSYGDHRMAMAFAPLAFIFDSVQIENPDVVFKSYPHFWDDLRLVGFEFH